MSRSERLPEFEKALTKLSKKYLSLPEDLKNFEKLLAFSPVGAGTNFVTIHHSNNLKVIKARLVCKSLRDRSMRIMYAYHNDTVTFVYIELYFKGDKENEDNKRVAEYIKKFSE